MLDWLEIAQRFFAQGLKKLILEVPRFFVRSENLRFHFFQLGRDETFAADCRLFADVTFRNVRQIRFRHLDEVTENGIEPDLKRLDAGLRDLALLQLSDPILPFARTLPQLVQIGIETVAKNSAVLQHQRRIFNQSARQLRR